MDFSSIESIKQNGFVGFKTINDLFIDCSIIPSERGLYLILNINQETPCFLGIGSGGHFKGKDPNVPIEILKNNWVDDTVVIYIGKAGGEGSVATLKTRLKQYLGFGQGKNIGHWGGRFIWQLSNYKDLVVCWKPLLNGNTRAAEEQLIKEFKKKFGNRPFANLAN